VALGAVDRLDGMAAGRVSARMADNSGTASLRETSAPVGEAAALRHEAAALRHEAAEQGYLFFRRLIAAADVLALRARVLDVCREIGWLDDAAPVALGVARPGVRIGAYDAAWTSVQCRIQPLPEFGRLREHPSIMGVLETIHGRAVRCGRGDTCRIFSPGCPELTTRPHQDHFYVGGDTALWTVWVPLGDCPLELGGLAVLPGSHRGGLLPHVGVAADERGAETDKERGAGTGAERGAGAGAERGAGAGLERGAGAGAERGDGTRGDRGVEIGIDAVWASADYGCGDVLMFNSLTLHRALENRTANRLRVSADFRYDPDPGARIEGHA